MKKKMTELLAEAGIKNQDDYPQIYQFLVAPQGDEQGAPITVTTTSKDVVLEFLRLPTDKQFTLIDIIVSWVDQAVKHREGVVVITERNRPMIATIARGESDPDHTITLHLSQ